MTAHTETKDGTEDEGCALLAELTIAPPDYSNIHDSNSTKPTVNCVFFPTAG
jgi:hypothetical protein